MTNSPSTPPPSADAWTVRRILEWTTGHLKKHGSETPRLDAEILLAHARGCRRIQLYTDYDEPVNEEVRGRMRELVQRRAAREPVAYLVGHREFFSLNFRVSADVLIPRPDTETLVVEAVALAKQLETPAILDLCTGSGCIAVAIAKNVPQSRVTAVDVSESALRVARENAAAHGVADRLTLVEGDLFAPLTAGDSFQLIVSNPPYVRSDELQQLQEDVRLYEPRLALDGGADGLDVVRRILREAGNWLAPGGWLLLEVSPEQIPHVETLARAGELFDESVVSKDLGGHPRVWSGRRRQTPVDFS